MISAYEAGKKALSGVLEDKRLDADRVTEAMLDIQDVGFSNFFFLFIFNLQSFRENASYFVCK